MSLKNIFTLRCIINWCALYNTIKNFIYNFIALFYCFNMRRDSISLFFSWLLAVSHNQDVSVSSGEKLSPRCHKVDESLAYVSQWKLCVRLPHPELRGTRARRPEEGINVSISTYPTLLGRLAACRAESRQCLDPAWTLSNHAGRKWRRSLWLIIFCHNRCDRTSGVAVT